MGELCQPAGPITPPCDRSHGENSLQPIALNGSFPSIEGKTRARPEIGRLTHKAVEAYILAMLIDWQKVRQELQNRRMELLDRLEESPREVRLAIEIKMLDDGISGCAEHLRRERARQVARELLQDLAIGKSDAYEPYRRLYGLWCANNVALRELRPLFRIEGIEPDAPFSATTEFREKVLSTAKRIMANLSI